jgi:hypothetical protein
MDLHNLKIQTVLISAFVSIVTLLLGFFFKAWFERHFIIFKLEAEHRYDQKKKVKEVLARHKTQLLDAGEGLNHRLWNFSENYPEKWHSISFPIDLNRHYYILSFTFRLLEFFACVGRVESEMVYLDTTIASKDDLDFVKCLRIFTQTMCDADLFAGLNYDNSYAKDHFFRNNFIHMHQCFLSSDGIVSYSDFKQNKSACLDEAKPMIDFLNAMNPEEARLRWDRLQAFHYVLIMFLNSYGYDFQHTDQQKMLNLLAKQPRKNKVIENLKAMVTQMRLDRKKEFRKILETLNA